jgi:hypothetical protein
MPEYVKRVYGVDNIWHWNPNCPDYPHRGEETVLILNQTPRGAICSKCSEVSEKSDD